MANQKTKSVKQSPSQPNDSFQEWHVVDSQLRAIRDEHLATPKPLGKVDEALSRLSLTLGGGTSHKPTPITAQTKTLVDMQRENTLAALKECASIVGRRIDHRKALTTLKAALKGSHSTGEKKYALDAIGAVRESAERLNDRLGEIAQDNPEAFYVVRSRPFRQYSRQLNRGRIAQTPYVRDKISEITEALETSRVVVIHGPTGSGKTEVAQVVGRQVTGKEPLMIYGHRDVSAREFRGHDVLTKSSGLPLIEIPNHIDRLKAEYRVANPHTDPARLEAGERQIEERFMLENNVTVSDFALGYLYQAARDGKALIIDEFNLIPGSVLKGLYAIMTKQPGEFIHVPENGHPPFPVHPDFFIIMTGNINTGGHATYLDREKPDASDKNRARFVKYDFLPQATEGSTRDTRPEDKQLYEIMLSTLRDGRLKVDSPDLGTRVEDRAITTVLPGGAESLDGLWRLAKLAAITQLALEGKATGDSPYAHRTAGVAQAAEVDHALSPRVVVRILESWKNGFEYELDHYIYRELVDGALSDLEKDYFYRQMRLQGFCQSEGWPIIDEKRATDGYLYSNVSSPRNKETREVLAVPGRLLVQEIYGEPPSRVTWPSNVAPQPKVKRSQLMGTVLAQVGELSAEIDALLKETEFLA